MGIEPRKLYKALCPTHFPSFQFSETHTIFLDANYFLYDNLVGRNKTIFLSSDYDHICNDRIQTIKTEFTLSPYFKLLSSDYGHIFLTDFGIGRSG